MKRKKVIIIGPAYPLRGGIADSNHALGLALKKMGHEVLMLSFSLQYPSLLFPGKTQFEQDGSSPDLEIHTQINSINPFSWIKSAFWLKRQNPDIVLTRFWVPFIGLALGAVLRLSGLRKTAKLIALCDNVIPHEKRLGDSMLTGFFLNANAQFLVMSKSVGNDLSKFVMNPVVHDHPHPVYDQFGILLDKQMAIERLGLDSSKKYLLFFGFIRKYKGLDLLLDAMPQLPDDVELIVAGEFYDDAEFYKKKVLDLKRSDRVHFYPDFIPQDQVNLYFSASDMVVQPYRSATQSGVAQIAYHFNKPILVTRVGGLGEVVAHKKLGYVVDVNPDAIAEAIHDFYDENREAQFAENVSEEKKKYSWSNMAKIIIENS